MSEILTTKFLESIYGKKQVKEWIHDKHFPIFIYSEFHSCYITNEKLFNLFIFWKLCLSKYKRIKIYEPSRRILFTRSKSDS